mmetsp:Transcript_17586/g.35335  ORF Transcript_17586/g.35335 Transcript_17586/m.35335 type:complete len:91 (-) Transcript_17586:157-429(-)
MEIPVFSHHCSVYALLIPLIRQQLLTEMNGLRASSWVADRAALNAAEGAKAEAVPKVARRDRAESFMVSGMRRCLQIAERRGYDDSIQLI